MAWQDPNMIPTDWSDVKAPSLADFASLADRAMRRLPQVFQDAIKGVVIRVEDFPDDSVMDAMDLETPFDLLGLYQGVDLLRRSYGDVRQDVDRILIYRQPILALWSEGGEALGDIVAHVLLHEIGHHMGFSDEDMDAIEQGGEIHSH